MALNDFFPDGTLIDDWFYDISVPGLSELGTQYVLTQHGILDDGRVHTEEIQRNSMQSLLNPMTDHWQLRSPLSKSKSYHPLKL